jgi:ribose transport system substrate-binding protein
MNILRTRRPGAIAAAVAAVALAAALAACGSSGGSGGSSGSASASAGTGSGKVPASVSALLAQGYKGTFTAPPATGPKAVKGQDVWVISCGQVAASCSAPADAAMAAGQAAGWKMHLFDAKLNPANYTTGIDQAIADHANGIVTVAVDCDLARAPLLQAKAAGIKTVGIVSFDCNDPLHNTGSPVYSTFIKYNGEPTAGLAFQQWQALKAAWLIVKTNGEAKVIATEEPGFLISLHQEAGFVNEMKVCTTCSVLDTVVVSPTDLEGTGAEQKMQSAVLAHPTANGVVVTTDSFFAQFVNAALNSTGYSKLNVVGGECIGPEATAAIRAGGPEQACVGLSSQWEGWGAVDELNRQFADPGSAPADEGIGFQIVDKTHNLPASGAYNIPVNFIAAYEKVWSGQ